MKKKKEREKVIVTQACVVSKDGALLMPCKRLGHVRRLLENGEAKIIGYEPFTIQMLRDTTNCVGEFDPEYIDGFMNLKINRNAI